MYNINIKLNEDEMIAAYEFNFGYICGRKAAQLLREQINESEDDDEDLINTLKASKEICAAIRPILVSLKGDEMVARNEKYMMQQISTMMPPEKVALLKHAIVSIFTTHSNGN